MKDHFGISVRLRKLRGDKSQREFAAQAGVPLRTYVRYEKGDRIPPDEVLEAIATASGKPVTWLTRGTFDMGEYLDGVKSGKKVPDTEIDETLTIGLLRYVKKYPKEFDRLCRILEEGNSVKIDAVKSLLLALDPD